MEWSTDTLMVRRVSFSELGARSDSPTVQSNGLEDSLTDKLIHFIYPLISYQLMLILSLSVGEVVSVTVGWHWGVEACHSASRSPPAKRYLRRGH